MHWTIHVQNSGVKGGVMVSNVASQQKGLSLNPSSPCACMGILLRTHASSPSPKTCCTG